MADDGLWKAPDVVPSIGYADVPRAVEWLGRVFGFRERKEARLSWPGGARTWIEIGDSLLSIATVDESWLQAPGPAGSSVAMKVYVDDLDGHFARAKAEGATIVSEPQDGFWGGRIYRALDLEGHRWEIAQRGRDLAAEQWRLPPGVTRGVDVTAPAEPALRPEQIQALEYARRQGTEAPVEAIRAKAARTFAELEALLAGVPERLAGNAPAPGKWSLHEIVDHLVVSHRRAVAELAALVAGEAPTGGPIPAGLVSPEPLARRWPELLADLRAVHRDFLQVLTPAEDDLPLAARAPVVLVVKCATAGGRLEPVEWIDSFDWKAYAILLRVHTLEHLGQVQRTLAAVEATS